MMKALKELVARDIFGCNMILFQAIFAHAFFVKVVYMF